MTANLFDAASAEADLTRVLHTLQPVAVAVSGGIDSLTMATLTSQVLPFSERTMFHAVSPAVPAEATERVEALASQQKWHLYIFDAGEFADEEYRRNPANRCFYCKRNLYGSIRQRTQATIVTGTNLDDLGEYRPGLDAARIFGVRHPYVETRIAKAGVRLLASRLGLGKLADLPAAPCLSSRIETGIRIEAARLAFVHKVERMLETALNARTVRCRIRREAIVIELDVDALCGLGKEARQDLSRIILSIPEANPVATAQTIVRYETYRCGSAFLR
jgi:pyridinium-3,5-biscarboxylic acid mononucleotide sulfurtransferase